MKLMMMMNNKIFRLGIVGVRGFVGKELLHLIANHPFINTCWVSSRQLAGQPISSITGNSDPGDLPENGLIIEELSPAQVAHKETDIIVLALPNGLADPYVLAIEQAAIKPKVIIDLSADYRFDDDWIYCLPELDDELKNTNSEQMTKISNPGCYATAMQLAIAPIKSLLSGPAHCFGVSGYSGAGTKPSPNNDPENLKDNLIGYGLVEHLHEKEVSARLQQPLSFSPSVAAFFRGINMTVQVEFSNPQTSTQLLNLYVDYYQHQPLVNCQQSIPVVKQVINTANCIIGGFAVSTDGKRATIVSCLDNLLKGAASQALQNINIALGLEATLSVQPSAGEAL